MIRRSVALVVLVVSALGACAPHQTSHRPSIPSVLTTVIVDRNTLALARAQPGLLLVVRDVDLPDRALAGSGVAIGPRGTDPRTGRGRLFGTGPDGSARYTVADTGEFTVLVMQIGYQRLQFDVRLFPDCHQTLEIYLGQDHFMLDSRTNPEPTPGRAVLTTCSPAT